MRRWFFKNRPSLAQRRIASSSLCDTSNNGSVQCNARSLMLFPPLRASSLISSSTRLSVISSPERNIITEQSTSLPRALPPTARALPTLFSPVTLSFGTVGHTISRPGARPFAYLAPYPPLSFRLGQPSSAKDATSISGNVYDLKLSLRCHFYSSLLVKSGLPNSFRPQNEQANIIRIDNRGFSSNNDDHRHNSNIENTLKTIRELHIYVKNNLSLDIWTLNFLLFALFFGPNVWNYMKQAHHTQDDYMFGIPVDDPVEHSVKILYEVAKSDISTGSVGNIRESDAEDVLNPFSTVHDRRKSLSGSSAGGIITPEEDVKRILNDLLASESLRSTASRIASGVIQSPPFQNACRALVKNIWDDLTSDPETAEQLTSLLQTVLQSDRIRLAVKDLLLQLINDEQVYRELTKLVVHLGEERDVLQATQQLLTESAHRTLNDPEVLDHSMEFATEVVGDDVVQRTGGEALRNTVGYAVQPSGGAVLAGIGTILVVGALHFYFLRRNGGESGAANPGSIVDLPAARGAVNNSASSPVSFSSRLLGSGPKPNRDPDNSCYSFPSDGHCSGSQVKSACNIMLKAATYPLGIFNPIYSTIINFIVRPFDKILKNGSMASEKLIGIMRTIYADITSLSKAIVSLPYSVWFRLSLIPSRLATMTREACSSLFLWVSTTTNAVSESTCHQVSSMVFALQSGVVKACQSFLGNLTHRIDSIQVTLFHIASSGVSKITIQVMSLRSWIIAMASLPQLDVLN